MRRVVLAGLVVVVIHLPIATVVGEAEPIVQVGQIGQAGQAGQAAMRVRFDFADGALVDVNGRVVLDPKNVEGGALKAITREQGWAIQFPPVCRDTPESCPRAILETDPAPFLNPAAKPVKWGAAVRLEPGMTTDGENIIQKGLSAGTQYKLQVDGESGQPSCVIAGTVAGVHRIIVATSPSGIADGAWHSLRCERHPELLRLMMDGGEMARQTVPASLEIANDLPLRLGGKGTGPANDQFHGALDDVFVEIG